VVRHGWARARAGSAGRGRDHGREPARARTDFPYEDGDLFRRAVSYVQEGLGEDAAGVLDRNAAALLGL
jgi:hypothetical protein